MLENKGAHEARSVGIQKSTAPWIGFMDSDDFVRPQMFSKLLSAGKTNNVDIVICGADRVTTDRKVINCTVSFRENKLVTNDIFTRFCRLEFGSGMLWNKLYRREVILPCSKNQFIWRQDRNEDLILNIGCFNNAKSIYLMNDILYEYVLNKSSITQTVSKADAFIEHYRAYALAIYFYGQFDYDIMTNITDLYRCQLANYSYSISDIQDLMHSKDDLLEAINLLYKISPISLALLSVSPRPIILGKKDIFRFLISQSWKKTKRIFLE